MDKTLLAYLAGVIDSDGYLTIRHRKKGNQHQPDYGEIIGLGQIQPDIPKLIYSLFGGHYRIERYNTRPNNKPSHHVRLHNLVAHRFIKAIYPYLRIKKPQADICFELRQSMETSKRVPKKIIRKWKGDHPHIFTVYIVDPTEMEKRAQMLKKIKALNVRS